MKYVEAIGFVFDYYSMVYLDSVSFLPQLLM